MPYINRISVRCVNDNEDVEVFSFCSSPDFCNPAEPSTCKKAQLLQTARRHQPQAWMAGRCSPCARPCTGSCHRGRRAGEWGLRGGGSAAVPAGCRPGRSKGQHSGSTSRRHKWTCRGWSRSRRWCHFGPASSLQPGRERARESLVRGWGANQSPPTPVFLQNSISSNSGHLLLFKRQSKCQIHALFTSKGNTAAHVWHKEADFKVLATSTQHWVSD